MNNFFCVVALEEIAGGGSARPDFVESSLEDRSMAYCAVI
jgi:hypothetical protein